MIRRSAIVSDLVAMCAALVLFVGLYEAYLWTDGDAGRYLFLHVLAELFSIAIACGIFMFAWNTRRIIDNNYLLLVGIAYLFVGILDTVHTIAYKGMGVLAGGSSDWATQLWISARFLESGSLLLAPLLMRCMPRPRFLFAAYAAVTAFLLTSIFHTGIFPTCYVEGVGLTAFKIGSEYVICAMLLVSLLFLFRARTEFDRRIFRLIAASIVVTIASEMSFTKYVSVYGFANLLGHYFKIISFYLIYKAIIETGLSNPFSLLFLKLRQHEDELQKRSHDLVERVRNLDCLYSIHALTEKGDASLQQILKSTVDLMPAGWRYPEIACARITFDDQEFKTSNFKVTSWRQTSDIIFRGRRAGMVEVCYLEERPTEDEGPFVKEERNLIDVIAFHCGRVAERKTAEEALKAEKEFTDTALNAQTDTFFVFDPLTGKALRWNTAFSEVSGYTDEEIASMKAPDSYYCEEDLKKAAAATRKVFEEGTVTLEVSLVTKDGRRIPTEYTASTITDDEGNPKYIIAVGRDITERKRAEEERERMTRLKDQMVRIASHDLKNPLMSIAGLVGLIQELAPEGSTMTEEAYDCLAKTEKSVEVMHNIIQNFLDFHALEDGELRLRFESLNLNEIAQDVVSTNFEYAKRKKMRVALKALLDLPRVPADRYRIHQVVDNLVNNAIKFSPEGSRVDVVTQTEDGNVVLEVRDSGPGLKQDDMKRVFTKYARLSTRPTGGEKSVGLGLVICKHLIDLHQGDIGVRNNPDAGCTFWFRLPLSESPAEPGD
jgi:PAS domain S-box-containing protein